MTFPPAMMAGILRLPSFPAGFARLREVLSNENSSVTDVERTVKYDPTFTANILKMANSAFFRSTQPVETVRQAVALLGRRRLLEIASGAAFARLLPKRLPGYEIEASAFWQHCVAAAILSERLAADINIPNPDVVFTAALLHDIGKLVISTFLDGRTEEITTSLRDTGLTSLEAERSLLQTDHAEVGWRILKEWNMPDAIVAAARWHHSPGEIREEPDRRTVMVIHVADGLCHLMGYGSDIGELARRLDPAVEAELPLNSRLISAALEVTAESIREMTDVFGELGGGHS